MVIKLIRIFLTQIAVFSCVQTQAGHFTPEGLKQFLIDAYKNREIRDSAFSCELCLMVENLTGQGGVLTGQLFLVKSNYAQKEQYYIVKELIAGEKEIFDLSLAANYKPLRPYIAPNSVKNFPIILLPIAFLYYTVDGKDYYFSVMPKATGEEFLKIMKNYVAEPTPEHEQKLKKAYATLGRTLGNFHKAFMKSDQNSLRGTTLIHGDLHVRNFFYDAAIDTIYWIDNECLGVATVRPQSMFVDIQDALFKHFYQEDWFCFDQTVRNSPGPWVEMFYPIFFDAYLTAFGGDKKIHAQELKELFAQMENTFLRELSNKIIDQFNFQ